MIPFPSVRKLSNLTWRMTSCRCSSARRCRCSLMTMMALLSSQRGCVVRSSSIMPRFSDSPSAISVLIAQPRITDCSTVSARASSHGSCSSDISIGIIAAGLTGVRTPQCLTCRGPSMCWTPAIIPTQSRVRCTIVVNIICLVGAT